jgi:hypothetical protein
LGCGKDKLVSYDKEIEGGMKIFTVTEIAPNGELFDLV